MWARGAHGLERLVWTFISRGSTPCFRQRVATGGALGFPRRAYAKELGTAIAVGAPLVGPSACGSQHRGANAWLNHRDYPVSAQQFLRDLSHLSPEQQGWIPRVGETWRLEGHTRHEVGAAEWVTIGDASDERSFEHLEVPRMVDPSPTVTAAQLRTPIKRWVEQVLHPRCRGMGSGVSSRWCYRAVTAGSGALSRAGCPSIVIPTRSCGCKWQAPYWSM